MTDGSRRFGIIVSCYRGDLPLLRGCLESIRSTFPALPVCLVKHGEFPTTEFRNAFGALELEQRDVMPVLQDKSYGYGLTKMVSFWESPFDVFMHIDADTVCWGNFIEGLDWNGYDFIYNEPHETITDRIQKSQYFDPNLIKDLDRDFSIIPRDYFNSGVFIARKGIFDIHEYEELLDFQKRTPNAFLCGDQGILNYLLFRSADKGKLRIRSWPFQVVVPCVNVDILNRRFSFAKGVPIIEANDQRLVHWAGPKPLVTSRAAFRKPMSYFRKRYHRRVFKFLGPAVTIVLPLEEMAARSAGRHDGSYLKALRSKSRHLFRLTRRWKRNVKSA